MYAYACIVIKFKVILLGHPFHGVNVSMPNNADPGPLKQWLMSCQLGSAWGERSPNRMFAQHVPISGCFKRLFLKGYYNIGAV